MNIRPYCSHDWARVCEIHDAARRDELVSAGLDAAYLTLEQIAVNEGFHEYAIRVAEVDARVLGFVAFTDDELAWLYVDPAAYGNGVGSALIRDALSETEASMTAEVLDGNNAAVAFYRKVGFEVVGREQGFMPGNESFRVSVTVLRHSGAAQPSTRVRREKALSSSGCESRPATAAPAGSNRRNGRLAAARTALLSRPSRNTPWTAASF